MYTNLPLKSSSLVVPPLKFKYSKERDFFDIVHQWKKLSFFENYGPESPTWSNTEEFLTGVRHGIAISENENIDIHQVSDWLSGYKG